MAEEKNNSTGKEIAKAGGAAALGTAIGGIPGAIAGAAIAIGISIFKAMKNN